MLDYKISYYFRCFHLFCTKYESVGESNINSSFFFLLSLKQSLFFFPSTLWNISLFPSSFFCCSSLFVVHSANRPTERGQQRCSLVTVYLNRQRGAAFEQSEGV